MNNLPVLVHYLATIGATMTSDSYNAFIEKTGPDLPSKAGGPLSGYTLALKDIFDVAGYVTGCGNPQREAEGEPAKQTATLNVSAFPSIKAANSSLVFSPYVNLEA